MKETIDPIISWLKENYPLLAVLLLATIITTYFAIRTAVLITTRWKYNRRKVHGGSRQFMKPKTWVQLQPRQLLKAKTELLSSPAIREFYAPVDLYKEEREPNKLYLQNAWLSPFKDAARASVKQNKAAIKGKHLPVRRQVADAAKQVIVRPLPEAVRVAGDRSLHYEVALNLARRKRSEVSSLMESITSAVEAESVEPYEKGRTNAAESFIVHMKKPESILTTRTIDGATFFKENPARKWNSFPMACDEAGETWFLSITHTIIYGMTGSGKSSPLQATIIQAIPFVLAGEAQLFLSDLKETEGLPWDYSALFEDIAFTTDDTIEIINMLYAKLQERNRMKRAWLNFEEGKSDLQRRLPATKKTPMMIFLIDELLSLLLELFNRGAEGKAAMATLAKIMALGRAVGVYVIAATQNVKQEYLGPMRDNFVNAIVLRNVATIGMNELFLGDGAIEQGYDPRKIEESTDSNNYKTSGIGYVKGETGEPKLVRFAHSSDEYIASLIRAHPDKAKMATLKSGELEQTLEALGTPNEDINEVLDNLTEKDRSGFLEALKIFKLNDQEDEGDFSLEALSLDKANDF